MHSKVTLVPEFEISKEQKDFFLKSVKQTYLQSPKKQLVISVSEGVRWYDAVKDNVDVVYASKEVDEFGHPRLGGISGIVALEITNRHIILN